MSQQVWQVKTMKIGTAIKISRFIESNRNFVISAWFCDFWYILDGFWPSESTPAWNSVYIDESNHNFTYFRNISAFSSITDHYGSLLTIKDHDGSWSIMMDHHWPWSIMIHHDSSWLITIDHDGSCDIIFCGWCIEIWGGFLFLFLYSLAQLLIILEPRPTEGWRHSYGRLRARHDVLPC